MLKAITQAELKIKLDLHLKWLHGETGGERANLSYANLSSANLSSANLSSANLRYANLRYADLPAPPTLLLINWSDISDELCLELMRYDAANHPDTKKFDEWVKTGECPYNKTHWQRSANFTEKKELWKPGQSKSALELVELLFKEKGIASGVIDRKSVV